MRRAKKPRKKLAKAENIASWLTEFCDPVRTFFVLLNNRKSTPGVPAASVSSSSPVSEGWQMKHSYLSLRHRPEGDG